MKKDLIIILFATIMFILSGCTSIKGNSSITTQSSYSSSTIASSSYKLNSPIFFQDIGKTFNELKKENPSGVIQHYNIPDASAECLGEPEGKYAYYFLGTQSIILENYIDKLGDKFKCSGFYTTAGVLFPETKDNMSIADFFSTIGVTSYQYVTEVSPDQGWFEFKYKDMNVNLDTTGDSRPANGNFKPVTRIKSSYPVAISDSTLEEQNQTLVNDISSK